MAYITRANIESVFGVTNVMKWSQLNSSKVNTADTDRIARAIVVAENYVERRFAGGRYSVPFTSVPAMVEEWCAVLAGLWLYSHLGSLDSPVGDDDDANRFRVERTRVMREIGMALAGQIQLGMGQTGTHPTCPVVC